MEHCIWNCWHFLYCMQDNHKFVDSFPYNLFISLKVQYNFACMRYSDSLCYSNFKSNVRESWCKGMNSLSSYSFYQYWLITSNSIVINYRWSPTCYLLVMVRIFNQFFLNFKCNSCQMLVIY